MKQPNPHYDGVDLVLRSLVQTSPPPGMEDRILHRLQQHRLQQHRLQQRRTGTAHVGVLSLSRANTLRLYLAGAMAASVALAIIFSWHHHAVSSQQKARLESSALPFSAHPVTAPRLEQSMPSHLVGATHPAAPHRTTAKRAASFPAPEAPLTHQEKLLLVIARSPQPEVNAALDLARSTETITPGNYQLQASFHNADTGGSK